MVAEPRSFGQVRGPEDGVIEQRGGVIERGAEPRLWGVLWAGPRSLGAEPGQVRLGGGAGIGERVQRELEPGQAR